MRKFLLMALLLVFAQQAQAKMYKWVDENGVIQYGDNVPLQYQGQIKEINKRGAEIKKELTPEERKAKEEESARQKDSNEQRAERRRLDKVLLSTYSSVEEIDLKRDRDLQQVEASIVGTQQRLKSVGGSLDEFRKQAEAFTRSKKPVPAGLQDDLAKTEAEKQRLDETLAAHQQKKEEIRAKFESEKNRYLELRPANPAPKAEGK